MSRLAILLSAGLIAGLSTPAALAATYARVIVSTKGKDSSTCGLDTAPCRTFQHALKRANTGGLIIAALPGNYGAVEIKKSISIINDGAGTVAVERSSGTAISVNLGGDGGSVTLRGLTIEGRGSAINGIAYRGSGKLLVSKCLIQNADTGVSLIPGSDGDIVIEDSVIANNQTGVLSSGTSSGSMNVALNGVTIAGNGLNPKGYGLRVKGGTAAYQFTALTDTAILGNGTGLLIEASGSNVVAVTSTDSSIFNNDKSVVLAGTASELTLDRTTIRADFFSSIDNAGTIVSYGNNAIVDSVSGNAITPRPLR